MKKTLIKAALGVALITASTLSFAHTTTKTPFYSAQSPNGQVSKTLIAPFQVRVDNNSNYNIYVNVPNNPIHDYVQSGGTDSIKNNTPYSQVEIQLTTVNGYVFFDQQVPNTACVEVAAPAQGAVAINYNCLG